MRASTRFIEPLALRALQRSVCARTLSHAGVPRGSVTTVTVLDTTAEAASVQTQAQRGLGVAGRFRTAVEMSELTRQLASAGLRSRRPDLSEHELQFELLRQLYGFKPEAR